MDKIARARTLRQASTEIEQQLWYHLRNRALNNLKFKRQFSIGNYIVDFICLEKKLIVELDGSQHLDNQPYDEERTKYLNARGYKVIRFWNNEVSQDINIVLEKILIETDES